MTETFVEKDPENGDQARPVYGLRPIDFTPVRLREILKIAGKLTEVPGWSEGQIGDLLYSPRKDGMDIRPSSAGGTDVTLSTQVGWLEGEPVLGLSLSRNLPAHSREDLKEKELAAQFDKEICEYLLQEGVAVQIK